MITWPLRDVPLTREDIYAAVHGHDDPSAALVELLEDRGLTFDRVSTPEGEVSLREYLESDLSSYA